MAKAKTSSEIKVEVKVTIDLTIEEAKALNMITTYSAESFIEGYKKHLGAYYMRGHEVGIISLFETIRDSLPKEIDKANNVLSKVSEAIRKNKEGKGE